MARSDEAKVERLTVSTYVVPTDFPESDGTFEWTKTTMVVVELAAAGKTGMGWTYADHATARLVHDALRPVIERKDALAIPARHDAMVQAVRNLGRPGVASMAISAVDVALWDLKARLFDVALVDLLGAARDDAPVYGSGGFTSYPEGRLEAQLAGWAEQGIARVKMKVGRAPDQDVARASAARRAIGPRVELFVDANGAYSRKQALSFAERYGELDVRWFEEPVSSDDLEGLRMLRDRAPSCMDVAAGEYGYDPFYFRRMLSAQAVDVLQADATRCGGVSGFLAVAAQCEAHGLPLSAHCAPNLHAHVGCAVGLLRHVEYFHDHARIERTLLEGALDPRGGALRPDRARPGMGLELRRADAARYAA